MKNRSRGIMKRQIIISIPLLFILPFNIGRTSAQTGAVPKISFVDPTDSEGAYVNRTFKNVNVSVTDAESPDDLTAFIG